MSYNLYVVSGASNNKTAKHGNKKIEIAVAVYHAREHNFIGQEISEAKQRIAAANKAKYFACVLSKNDTLEKELVYERNGEDKIFESEDYKKIGWFVGGEIKDYVEERYKRATVGNVEYNRSVEYLDGKIECYMDNELVYTSKPKS
jgi:hypothetical protein